MTSEQRTAILEAVAEVLAVEPGTFDDDTELRDLGADSADVVEIEALACDELELETAESFPADAAGWTVGSLLAWFDERLPDVPA